MTNEDWQKVQKAWPSIYQVINLSCDGYELTLQPMIYKMRLVRMVYVNGWFKGEFLNDCEERTRFMRKSERFVFDKKYRDDMLKIWGKRGYNKRKDQFEAKIAGYYPDWSSFTAFKRHLKANNTDIKLIGHETE